MSTLESRSFRLEWPHELSSEFDSLLLNSIQRLEKWDFDFDGVVRGGRIFHEKVNLWVEG